MGGIGIIMTALALIFVRTEGWLNYDRCSISPFSSDVDLHLGCFPMFRAFNGVRTNNSLNALSLHPPENSDYPSNGEIIDTTMAEQIVKIYFSQSVYDPFYRFLFWLRNVKTAIENINDDSNNPCQRFDSDGFNETIKSVGYMGLLRLQRNDDSFDETQLDIFLQDLPIAVYLVMNQDYGDYSKVTLGDAETILCGEMESILRLLSVYGYSEQTSAVNETSSKIVPLLSETLTNLSYMAPSHKFTVLSRPYRVCSDTIGMLQDDIQSQLQPLTDALHDLSDEIEVLAKSISDDIAGNDDQHYSGSTSLDRLYSLTYEENKGRVTIPSATDFSYGKFKPTQKYRASYPASQEEPYAIEDVVNGFETEISIFASQGSTFAGARKDNVTINVINKKSFRDEARITTTVKTVTDDSIILVVATDTSASWSITMTINGQPVLNQQSTDQLQVDFTVNHSALTCSDHRFTDLGNAIEFQFNVPINVTRSTERGCEDFFEDISRLGESATCDLKTPDLLLVTIGEGENLVVPGDILVLKENVIKPSKQMFYRPLSRREFSISFPYKSRAPSFNIAGPTTINKCGSYLLRAEQISGYGGRPVTYKWLLQNSTSGRMEVNESPELSIHAIHLQEGMNTVSLTITNFLNHSQERSHIITVLDDIRPVLQIKSLNFIPNRVRAYSRVKLEAVVTYSFGDGCQSNENKPTYEWSSRDEVVPDELKDDRVLVLPPKTLPVGETIRISVTVMSTGNNPVTEKIQLVTVSSPLVAKITGANTMTLGPNDIVSLDGSQSLNPNYKNSNPLKFQWTCVDTSSLTSCDDKLNSLLTSSVLLIQTSLLTAGTYSIDLTVNNGASDASASVTLIIETDDVPVINITTVNEKTNYRDDEGIFIQANIKSSSEDIDITWREENDRLNPDLWEYGSRTRMQDEYVTHVVIPSDQTTPGFQYTLEVIATDKNGRTGFATFNIGINTPITNCKVTATPYREMSEITITATGCVADPDLVPLLYQPIFALPLQEGYKKIVLDGTSTDSSQTVIASPINYYQDRVLVGFRICDASFTCFDELVVTDYETAPKLSEREQENFINNSINKELEKGNIATAFRNAINIANLQKKTTLKTRRKRRDTAFSFTLEGDFDSVLLVVNGQNVPVNENDEPTLLERLAKKQAAIFHSAGPIDVNEGALMSDLSPQMLISMFTEDEIDGVFNTASRILDKATEEGSPYSKDTVERLLTTLKMGEDNLKSTTKENKERQNTARRLRQTALKQAGQDLNINEHVTFNVCGSEMFVAYSFPKDGEAVTDSIVHPVSVKLGSTLSERFGYDWCRDGASGACSGIKTMVIETNSMDKNIKTCSGTFLVSLLNPVTNEEQQIQDPITIAMATEKLREGETCACKYWNEETSRLESDGVTSQTTDDGRLLCESSRLAVFVGVYSTDGNARQEVKLGRTNPAILLGIVFGIIFVAILIAAVTMKVLKGNQRNKVTPVTKNSEDENIEGRGKIEDE